MVHRPTTSPEQISLPSLDAMQTQMMSLNPERHILFKLNLNQSDAHDPDEDGNGSMGGDQNQLAAAGNEFSTEFDGHALDLAALGETPIEDLNAVDSSLQFAFDQPAAAAPASKKTNMKRATGKVDTPKSKRGKKTASAA